jgi:hypothetical protein
LAIVFVMVSAALAQSGAPQSTSNSDAGIAAAVEAYRVMWRNLTPEQRNQALQSGGYAPEQYERVLRQNAGGRGASRAAQAPGMPDYNKGVTDGALDALDGSLRDLNAIRDANVLRLQKDGCPPEVASRVADLKGQLAAAQAELKNLGGADAPAAVHQPAAADPNDVATAWFQSAQSDGPRNPAVDLVDSVLPADMAPTRAPQNPQPLLAGLRSQTLAQDVARMQAEIARLQAACIAVKR